MPHDQIPRPRFADKTAVITGAGGGIGRALALALAGEGANLVCVGRNVEALARAAQEARERTRGQVLAQPADVGEPEDVKALAAAVDRSFGQVDVLVNNAGVGYSGTVLDSDPEEVEEMLRTNVFGTYLVTHHLLPFMIGRGGGDIINLGSVAGLKYSPGFAAYSASKFAVRAFSEALRNEVQGEGIRVLTLHPGMTRTGFFDRFLPGGGSSLPDDADKYLDPAQVARVVLEALCLPPGAAVNEIVVRPTWQER